MAAVGETHLRIRIPDPARKEVRTVRLAEQWQVLEDKGVRDNAERQHRENGRIIHLITPKPDEDCLGRGDHNSREQKQGAEES